MCVNVHESLNRLPACLYVIPKTPNGRLDLECRRRKKGDNPNNPFHLTGTHLFRQAPFLWNQV